jgi:chaperonin GroES
MELKPIGNRVVVSLLEENNISQSGIIIPDTVKGNLKRGTIRAVGKEVEGEIQIEDVILFNENAGSQVNIKNENYYIIDAEAILAIYGNAHF